jgi:glycosyltransferase involved in cell wall biosynthesis
MKASQLDLKELAKRVPVDDEGSALAFCRALVAALDQSVADQSSAAVQPRPERPPVSREPEISVVLPVYNEQDNLQALHDRLRRALTSEGVTFEVIFVDDGSTDGSVSLLHGLAAEYQDVGLVRLARNFGHQVAISAGIDFAAGQAVIVMDADLQDPPEVLARFISKWREGYEVVYAVRRKRKEHVLKQVAYAGFYRLLRPLASIDIPLDSGDFCIMDRKVVNLLRAMPERNRFLRGIRSWVGFRQIGLEYERDARFAGEAKYNLAKLFKLAVDGLVSFSYTPLRLASLVGFAVSASAFALGARTLYMKLRYPDFIAGFTTIVVGITLLGGIQLITLGIAGEYIGRIFDEVKQRPLYTVREAIGFDEP